MKSVFHFTIRKTLLVLASSIALAGCAGTPPQATLYERLGGLPAITAVVDKTLDRTATDPRTRRSFEGIKLKPLKESIALHLCEVTGGPCKYEGATMAKAHQGLDITSAEFDAMVSQLSDTLDQFKVGAREKNELLQLLAPMKRDVVSK